MDGSRRRDWVPVAPLNGGPCRYAPACLVYLGHPEAARLPERLRPDSSGAAAGATPGAARRAALFELLERDAVARWWQGGLRRPGFGTAVLGAPWLDRFSRRLLADGRLLYFLDLGAAHAIPVAAAVSAQVDGRSIVLGTAAGRTIRKAAIRAAGELAQNLLGLQGPPAKRLVPAEKRVARWLAGAAIGSAPWLLPCGAADLRQAVPAPSITVLLRGLRKQGIFVYDCEPPSPYGVPVARLMATGLARPRGGGDGPWRYPF
jgi:ribosomal protein S12 methylthiotransferase accessory factor